VQQEAFRQALRRLAGLPCIVGGGTALGLHRDGDLIATDADLDFLVIAGQEVETRQRFADCRLRYERSYDGGRTLHQLGWRVAGYPVDVHFYAPDPGGETYSTRHMEGRLIFHRGAFEQPELRATQYGLVPMPGDVERFLATKYGDDWRIPQHEKKGRFHADDGRVVTRVRGADGRWEQRAIA
jgi:hypothetical protein